VAAGVAGADAGVRQLLLNLSDAAILCETNFVITLWNAAAEQLLDYRAEEVLGSSIEALLPNVAARGRMSARRKDGLELEVEVSVTPVDGGSTLLIVREAVQRLDRLSAVMATALADSGTLRDVLGRAATVLVRHFDAAFARIWTFNETEQLLELQASAGQYTHLDGGHSRVPFGQLKVGRIASDRRPHLTNDVLNDPSVDRNWATAEGMVAFAGYPLVVEQRVVGVVGLFARHSLSPDALQELLGVSDVIGQYVERKRAQDLLEHSERRYRAMIEHAHGVISILAPNGTIVYESPYVHSVLGYRQGERIGTNGFELIHPDDRERALQTFSTLVMRSGDTVVDEFRFQHADGSYRWLEVTGHNLLGDPSVSGIVVYTRDISERKQSERDLQQSEKRFRALIERSSDMITLHRRNGTISYASPSTSRVLGYSAEELVDRNLLEYVHLDDQEDVAAAFRELLQQPGRSTTARYRMRHVDGSWRWIETTRTNLLQEPSVQAVVSNRRDVTAEVEAQQQLEQRVEERTRELASLLDVSQAASSTLELEPLIDELLVSLRTVVDYHAVTVYALVDERGPEQRRVSLAYRGPLPRERILRRGPVPVSGFHAEALRQLGPIIVADMGGVTGVMREMATAGEPIPPAAIGHARALLDVPLIVRGKPIGVLGMVHRVPGFYQDRHARLAMAFAQQAAAAIENARLYEAARGSAALAERQRLARELHDSVSQALFAIVLNSAALGESLRKQDARRATRLAKQLRQLARGGLAEMRALIFELRAESLSEEGLVAALVKQTAAVEARHGLKIRNSMGTEPSVPIDTKEALYRIAQEALHNVVKHATARMAEVELAENQGRVVLTVRDNGAGFETDAVFPGHLGLVSMRERAQGIGATFSIESARGAGTLVRVELPTGAVL
jgi:PAS domain S-box-containing protein